jgi:predicted nucleic acid-binding protein
VIIIDTTVLVYAVGGPHALAEPSQALLEAIQEGTVLAATTPEVIQEFVHARARRHGRSDAVLLGRAYAELLSPLLMAGRAALEQGLGLFERIPRLGAFDAVLAAVALESDAVGIVSADAAYAEVPRLKFLELGSPALQELIEAG